MEIWRYFINFLNLYEKKKWNFFSFSMLIHLWCSALINWYVILYLSYYHFRFFLVYCMLIKITSLIISHRIFLWLICHFLQASNKLYQLNRLHFYSLHKNYPITIRKHFMLQFRLKLIFSPCLKFSGIYHSGW